MFLGLDIGSISIKSVLLDKSRIIDSRYIRHNGRIVFHLNELAESLRASVSELDGLALTGNSGQILSQQLKLPHYNEVLALVKGVEHLYPEAGSVIEMGGEDAKLIFLSCKDGKTGIDDFYTNGLCAAGTGSFLDQQAHRLGIPIENQFSRLAMQSEHPARIAGRCSVFAKSDMIHSQQVGSPMEDILYGLCIAVAKNFKSTIGKGLALRPPTLFLGGVAFNPAMVKAFREIYRISDQELMVPDFHAVFPALGCIRLLQSEPGNALPIRIDQLIERIQSINALEPSQDQPQPALHTSRYFQIFQQESHSSPSSESSQDQYFRLDDHIPIPIPKNNETIPVYLGIDIGSVSTNLVLIDRDCRLITKRYLMTSGRPLEAVRLGLASIEDELGSQVKIDGVGVTGSGRYLISDFVGGDVIKNEITAQAKAAVMIDPEVDTIFEIGGQDSKYISLKNGLVIDFEMNKVCAAGTGSFLEEQADEMGIAIRDEFSSIAFQAQSPTRLGERCTVFMESDLKRHFHGGEKKENLLAGLAYSIVYNYLNKVVVHRKIGKRIFFQGGVANNRAVCAAFELALGQPIHIPADNNVTGAIGIAAIARDEHLAGRYTTKFYGFDLSKVHYDLKTFHCHECENICEIHHVSIAGRPPLYYGSRCEKYNVQGTKSKSDNPLPDLFETRNQRLLNDYPIQRLTTAQPVKRVGIPLSLIFYEYLPLWKAFFQSLGWEVITSPKTNKTIINQGIERFTTETCYPVKVAIGHIEALKALPLDYIFLPNFINTPLTYPDITHTHACPMIQSFPDIARPVLDLDRYPIQLIQPNIQLKYGLKQLLKELKKEPSLKAYSGKILMKALQQGWAVQQQFYREIEADGQAVMNSLDQYPQALVIIGRSYNIADSGINLNLPEKLRQMGIPVIPMDFLPLHQIDIAKDYPNMYWHYGQKILSAVKLIRDNPKLFGVYVSNFGCGPDSYILPYTEREFAGKPFLGLEIDEHSADAGLITRCEAFLDSIRNLKTLDTPTSYSPIPKPYFKKENLKDRIIYIPHMGDPAFGVAHTFRAYGIDARVFPPSDQTTLELGRKYSTGKECYPYLMTLGDIIKIIQNENGNHHRLAFFMPSATGPCRFGQYHFMQNVVLNELGYRDVYFINPNQGKDFYQEMNISGNAIQLLAWNSILFIEHLDKLLRETRPYETNPGDTDRVYQSLLQKTCRHIESKQNPRDLMPEVRRAFARIPVDQSIHRPKVGLVGEIFVRNHEFSNEFIARRLEKEGLEVWLPTISEWVFYTNHTRKFHTRIKGDWNLFIKTWIMDKVQRRIEKKYEQVFGSLLNNHHEPHIPTLIEYSREFLSPQYESEAGLTIAKSIDYYHKGIRGIVNTMPFGCMPGNIVSALTHSIRPRIGHIPWLNLAYDGNGSLNMETRIKTFVHQVKEYQSSPSTTV
ncbi:MAG: hypothetical protein KBA26_06330 [Candidatus Delongbacteria bacterium]|nr:hypothetical protein [Candidatus Delongbacteria bacterium]